MYSSTPQAHWEEVPGRHGLHVAVIASYKVQDFHHCTWISLSEDGDPYAFPSIAPAAGGLLGPDPVPRW